MKPFISEILFSQLVSNFTKWIEEVLVRGGKGAKRVEIALLRRGKYLGQILDDADFIKIESDLKQLKVKLQIGKGAGAFEIEGFFLKSGNPLMLEAHNAAMFVTDGIKMKLILRENATVYETLHELMHMRDCQKIGMKAFMQKSFVEREKFVYDKMVEYQEYLNRKELKHAEDYINWHYGKVGKTDNLGNPIKEILPFDLKSIPRKRQGININTIINLK
ncbi:zincin-like metallopeptidase toxin domain-containing protein [Chryseobacterium lineare]